MKKKKKELTGKTTRLAPFLAASWMAVRACAMFLSLSAVTDNWHNPILNYKNQNIISWITTINFLKRVIEKQQRKKKWGYLGKWRSGHGKTRWVPGLLRFERSSHDWRWGWWWISAEGRGLVRVRNGFRVETGGGAGERRVIEIETNLRGQNCRNSWLHFSFTFTFSAQLEGVIDRGLWSIYW